MHLLLSSQSSAVGKSPRSKPGGQEAHTEQVGTPPHLPCREGRQGGAAQTRVRGRATLRATQATRGSPTPSLGALQGRGEEGSPSLPGRLLPFLPVDHFHLLSQDVSGTRGKPEAVWSLCCPCLQVRDACRRGGSSGKARAWGATGNTCKASSGGTRWLS